MRRAAFANMRRSTETREPLHSMEEICDQLGVTRFWVSAMSRKYGPIKPEFDRHNSSCGKRYFKMSTVREWLEAIPEDVRARPPRKRPDSASLQ